MVKQNSKVPVVSIIIISYNNFDLLENCLKSLYNFTLGIEFEVIVIDNNSTEQGIENIIKGYDNLVFIKNDENIGFAKANNQGLKSAHGEYVLYLNNDTILIENSIYDVYHFARKLDQDTIIGCKLIYPDGTLQHSVYDFPTVWNVFTSNFFLYLINKRNKIFSKYHLMNSKINETTEVDVVTGAFLFANTISESKRLKVLMKDFIFIMKRLIFVIELEKMVEKFIITHTLNNPYQRGKH